MNNVELTTYFSRLFVFGFCICGASYLTLSLFEYSPVDNCTRGGLRYSKKNTLTISSKWYSTSPSLWNLSQNTKDSSYKSALLQPWVGEKRLVCLVRYRYLWKLQLMWTYESESISFLSLLKRNNLLPW